MSAKEKQEWELPQVHGVHHFLSYKAPAKDEPGRRGDFWNVTFYPYTEPGIDPVFAAVGREYILICRTPRAAVQSKAPEIIQFIVDEEPNANNFTCAWTKDLISGVPLLCVAGETATIKIVNALTGELCRTLAGHGNEIDDLMVSPVNPQILASSSNDSTVRIWSLEPAHEKQPCAAILAGDGHRGTVLTVAFHANGRFLLSGGRDHIVNLWTLPEFPDSNTGTNKTTRIHYPHFSSSEIHDNDVDCVAFHGDLILSKAGADCFIVLWSINGFSSKETPPPPSSAPTTHDHKHGTRSSFAPAADPGSASHQYTRLMQFDIPGCETLWVRFSLYPGSSTTHPVLAISSTKSRIYFWDLKRFEEFTDYISSCFAAEKAQSSSNSTIVQIHDLPSQPQVPPFLKPFSHRNREKMADYGKQFTSSSRERVRHANSRNQDASADSSSYQATGSNRNNETNEGDREAEKENAKKSLDKWAKQHDVGDPWSKVKAHKVETVQSFGFMGRQVAWSTGGEWCVVAGSHGAIAILGRQMVGS